MPTTTTRRLKIKYKYRTGFTNNSIDNRDGNKIKSKAAKAREKSIWHEDNAFLDMIMC